MSEQPDSRPDQPAPEPERPSSDSAPEPAPGSMPAPAPMPQPPPMSYPSSPAPGASPQPYAPPGPSPQPYAPPGPSPQSPAPGSPAATQPSAAQPDLPPGYALANPHVPPTNSGLATGGLVSGVLSCLLGLLSCCWWPMFALPALMGVGALLLGYLGMRQVNASAGEVSGRGIAIAAMATGGAGLFLTLAAAVAGLILQASGGSLEG